MARPRGDGAPPRPTDRRKFTDKMLKGLAADDRPYLVWDSIQKGFVIAVHPSGLKTYRVIYNFGGRPRWYTISATNAISLTEARRQAGKVMIQVVNGIDPQAEKKASRSSATFEEIATRYVKEYAKKKNKSWEQADYLVRRYAIPRWAKLRASDISRSDVKSLIGNIGSPSVANQTLAACSPIFSWAIREEIGQVKVNPCAKIEMNEKTDRERILSDSEITKFWAAFEDEGLLASVALKTVLLTGQRPGEVRHMRREHIKDGWWDLPGKPIKELGWPGTKNGESNRIWLPTAVQDLIAEIGEAETGFVFANDTGKPIRALDEAMRNVCTRLEIGDKVTPHDLRRTFGTTVTRLGFGRQAMDRILNHTDSGVGSVYDRHGYAAEDKKIMEAVTAKFMAMINGEQEADNVVRIAS